MKKFILSAIISGACSLFAMAQDGTSVIVLDDGSVINAGYVEVGPKTIFYQISEDQPLNKIDISKVLVIKYANGEKWVADHPSSAANATPDPEPSKTLAQPEDYSDREVNDRLKRELSPANVSYSGKESAKEAGMLALLYGSSDDSVIGDRHLELVVRRLPEAAGGSSMTTRVRNPFAAPVLQAEITNRSDKTVYIDLANTFIVIDGMAHRFFENTATSSTVSSTKGAGVNLGAVAGALGIGGAAGRMASGINVGGSSGQATTTTVFAERVEAIPPHATKVLDGIQFPEYDHPSKTGSDFGMTGDGVWKVKRFALAMPKDEMIKCGQDVTSPAVMRKFPEIYFTLDYSLDEDFTNTAKLSAKYEAQRLIGVKDKKELGPEKDSLIYLYLKPLKKN